MPKRASKSNSKVEGEGEIELETLSTEQIKEFSKRGSANAEQVQQMVDFIKSELVDAKNGDGFPKYVNLHQLHEKFALKPSHSKKTGKYWLTGKIHRILHKNTDPPVLCKYLRREDATTFISFYTKAKA